MDTFKSFKLKLYEVNDQSFADIALDLFRFQATHNKVYRYFLQCLEMDPTQVQHIKDIPFLPVSFFKTQTVKSGEWEPELWFTSSSTTGATPSRHAVYDPDFYLSHAKRCFEFFFGSVENYHFLALLPSYLERTGSSLIAMIDHFIKESKSSFSGFYLHDTKKLLDDLVALKNSRTPILWGVSFALLDLAEKNNIDLSHCLIFETGGMKGRRKEITREELQSFIKEKFNVEKVFSEYGMTELLSQAYTQGANHFRCPPWMRVLGRELTDPMNKGLLKTTAAMNVVDLANWHSISFIETEDIGKIEADGSFKILGRMDNTEVRGCNLLVD